MLLVTGRLEEVGVLDGVAEITSDLVWNPIAARRPLGLAVATSALPISHKRHFVHSVRKLRVDHSSPGPRDPFGKDQSLVVYTFLHPVKDLLWQPAKWPFALRLVAIGLHESLHRSLREKSLMAPEHFQRGVQREGQ